MSEFAFDWAELAFGSKKPVNQLNAIFIAAPRDSSIERFKQLVKTYLPKANLVVGIAKEDYILGLENQPQFTTLKAGKIEAIISKVNASSSKHKIYTLTYSQRDTKYLLEKLDFQKVIWLNGSWYHAFHLRTEYYVLAQKNTPYELVTPFASENEAKIYTDQIKLASLPTKGRFSQQEMTALIDDVAKHSFAYSEHQTGVALGKKQGSTYELLTTAHNKIVPYETYAMHHGASRETNFSPMNDLNHYDALHAEVCTLIKVQKQKINLKGTTLFINLLPCPACARMISETDIAEIIYREDHSAGYAIKLFEAAGKKVKRSV